MGAGNSRYSRVPRGRVNRGCGEELSFDGGETVRGRRGGVPNLVVFGR